MIKLSGQNQKVMTSFLTRCIDQQNTNTVTFTLDGEDHTLGNVVCDALLQHPAVVFAAYTQPHPLQQRIVIKIKTNDKATPEKVFEETLNQLQQDLDKLSKIWRETFVLNEKK